jgi:signal peptidase II
MQKLSNTGLAWTWVVLLVVLVDRITKTIMLHSFHLYEATKVTSFFNLTLTYNRGAAFSFLNSAGGWQSKLFGIVATVISLILLGWLLRLNKKQRWTGIAVAMVLGGALGNLSDRLTYGHVIDFIQLHVTHFYWPVFNVADSAICVGAFMLIFEALIFKKR